MLYSVFESFEDNAAQEWQLPPACPTADSRNLVPISLENLVAGPKVKVERAMFPASTFFQS